MRLIIILLILCSSGLSAQKYNFVNWTVEDGLIQSQASCIIQDQFRQLWIGTEGGISRFDGRKFSNLTVQDGLPSNRVISMMNDSKGRMWIGTANGLCFYNGKKFTKVKIPGDAARNVFSVSEINNRIFALINFRLYQINEGTAKLLVPTGDSTDRITTVLHAGASLLVYVFRKGLFSIAGDKTIKVCGEHSQKLSVRKICITSQGDTLLLANQGLLQVKDKKIQTFRKNDLRISQKNLLCIAEDDKKNLWVGTENGVIKITRDELTSFSDQSGFTANSVNTIYKDLENNLWFGTNGDGIFKFRENTFTYYDQSSGLESTIVMGIAQTEDSTIYTGGYGGGLYQIDRHNQLSEIAGDEFRLKESKINCLYADKNNTLLIGTLYQGIYCYSRQKGLRKLKITHQPDNQILGITCFLRDEQDNLLIGSQQGLYLLDTSDTLRQLNLKGGLVTTLKQFDGDHILLGTSKGLFILDKNYDVLPFYEKHFSGTSLLCLAKSGENLWLGTTDIGVINFNLRTMQTFTYNTANGLPSNFIYSMDVSDPRRPWFGTGFGISNLRIDDTGKVLAIKNYGRSDGLLGMECNHNSILKAKDESLWFGTTKGLFHFNPETNISEKVQPFVFLRSVKLFSSSIPDSSAHRKDQWFDVPDDLVLRSRENHLSFELSAIFFTNPSDVLFRYSLNGIDKGFTTTSNPIIIYPSLPPGKYILKVHGITKNGVFSSNEINYHFEIQKAFYQTNLFQFLVILFLIGSGALSAFLITRARQKRRQKEKEMLQKIREEEFSRLRQRTAEDFHDEMGNSLTRISVLTDVLKSKLNGREQEVTRLVQQIKENTTALYSGSRDIIWSLNAENDGLYEITEHLRQIGEEGFSDSGIEFVFQHEIPQDPALKLKLDYSRNLTMIFKEAYSNIHKHAGATVVKVFVRLYHSGELFIEILDNGKGFDRAQAPEGNGLKNISSRAGRMSGRLEVTSYPGKGTQLRISLKNIFA